MLLDTPSDAREKFVVELVQALKRAGGYPPGTPMQTDITSRVMQTLRSAVKGGNEIRLEASENGVLINEVLHSFEAQGVAALAGHMINRLATAVVLPKQVPVDDLWRFLVIFGGSPERLRAAGGALTSLADAGVFTIRVEEEPVTIELRIPTDLLPDQPSAEIDILTSSSSWNELPPEVEAFGVGDEMMTREISNVDPAETVPHPQPPPEEDLIEEITPWEAVSNEIERAEMGENTLQAVQGGDTQKSDLGDNSPTSTPPTLLERITRRVIRSRRPDGPDEAAVALLEAWRHIFKFETNTGELPARPIAATLQRLDPLVRYMILARLARSSEGRAISGLMPDGPIAEAVAFAVTSLQEEDDRIKSLLRTVRPRGAILIKLLNQISNMLEERDQDTEAWERIRQGLADESAQP